MGGHVYFLKAEGLNVVKIGFTTSKPYVRKDGIQTMCPVKLHRIGLFKTHTQHPRGLEKRFHSLFEPLHMWGEWYEFPGDMIGTLKRSIRIKKHKLANMSPGFNMELFESMWRKQLGTD